MTGWASLAAASDWSRPPRQMIGTAYWYLNTDQFRYDRFGADVLASPLGEGRFEGMTGADCLALSARTGWMPSYPTFDRNPLELGETFGDPVANAVAELRAGTLKFACEDPDAPENWPRIVTLWRANLLGSSAKGAEYFTKHLLGTHSSLRAEEAAPGERPRDVVWHEEAPEGKLDLLLSLDFRHTSSTLLSDVVLPAATWYEKHDLSSTDMHPYVHAFSPAVSPPWQTRTDFDTFKVLAEKLSELAAGHLGVRKDLVAAPLQHDTPGEIAQPGGVVRDWRRGECDPEPGKTMPNLVVVERDYTAIGAKFAALGPLVEAKGLPAKGITLRPDEEVARLRELNGAVRGGPADGRPALDTAVKAANTVLALSGTTNGRLATQGFHTLEAKTGQEMAHLAAEHEGKRVTYADTQAAPVPVITSPEWSGSEAGGRRYTAFTLNTEHLKPWHTLTGRQHFFLDHDWMHELGEALPVYRPPLDMSRLFGEPRLGPDGDREVTVRYLTPHNKWSIHSEYQDNLFMLALSRGGQTIWMSARDAEAIGVGDDDWIEAVNRNGVVVARAIVSHRMPPGTVYMHHAQERTVNVPLAETTGKRGGIHNSLTRLLLKPSHLIGGYAQLSWAFNYLGPTGNQRDEVTVIPPPRPGGRVLMRVMAQVAMVMNLDKCIGCHTCSVTCKQAWTNRRGMEYVWFNNVETRPGQGYPRRYEDQGEVEGRLGAEPAGRAQAQGGRPDQEARRDLLQPEAPGDQGLLRALDLRLQEPHRRPARLRLPGRPARLAARRQTDEDRLVLELGRRPGRRPAYGDLDPMVERTRQRASEKVRFAYEETFMFYLPRICEHCLNPSCVASCPSGAMYKRSEDGIVLVDQDRCRGWRMCVTGCPYKKVYFNHRTGKAEKCTFCYPRIEIGQPTVCSETCVGRLRYLGVVLYDADKVTEAASTPDEHDLYAAQLGVFLDPEDPEVRREAEKAGIPFDWIEAARRSPVHALVSRYRVALPLHPEYRTMPMVWYIPPLSPVVDALTETGHDGEDADNLFGAIDTLRIPLEYLAEVFTAGDTGPVRASLEKLAAMRAHMRAINLGEEPDPAVCAGVGMRPQEVEDMYRLLAIAKYEERYVIPTAAVGDAHRLEASALPDTCSLDTDGGPGMGGDGPFGQDSGRRRLPLVSVENFHILRRRQTTDDEREV